ncbi:PolC-type DNA polymerase III [Bariatricus massiliensis]|uniref:DNA polymerase III PolC-type n=1 Tax=Bariatricus massiliensis TaxID=1745713 RepID=A0ABS8DJA7_9FIRM|nr:PolC-type DNA polymerase III [Bariatricus massiliensis]MCB7305370.1 PolC-type DNA polymerase III [Bariatricus massiliensis]MCB7375924.1 PolC-type DNA polymerase III [Bariatricus massiliensis]MCB7388513.1 PolC-type DNA polymerase III [Bariatricus massiliensis]MCB7412686.1 PolC-type DNA polymerase III [Bariatricus massiliensis]MCQ5252104.1 PolC-type DNA polymerase III [Bariatricus massiliensis]
MGKLFFDVFPTLKTDADLRLLFQEVEVTKVTSTSAKNYIKVHIFSTHLIPKHAVLKIERQIETQLFGQCRIPVSLVENYRLSEQYTPENLMDVYRDSMLLELEQKSVVEKNMFQKAKVSFENGNILCLTMVDTIIAEGKTESIVTYLKDIFGERFHVPIEVRIHYEEVKESKYKKFNELQVQQEVNAILERNQRLQADNAAKNGEKSDTPKSDKEEEKKTEKKEPKKQEISGKTNGGFKGGKGSGDFQRKEYRMKKSDDPNVIYGRDFDDNPIELKQVVGEMGEITIRGQVINFDTREIRNEKTIIMFAVTDFTDTITVKMFARNEQLPELLAEIKKGVFLKIKGVTTIDKFDGELTIGSVTGIRRATDNRVGRKDKYPEKRVELHCHTKMSDMDGVSEAKDLVKRAHDWGHPAIAITDHGVVQAFTDANHYIETLDKGDPFKIIYGVEGYLVDDLTEIAVGAGSQSLDDTFVVFDIETTGFSAISDKIIEIGAVKVEKGVITEKFSTFVNPKRPIPFKITQLTSITDEMVLDSPYIETVLPQFLEFVGDAVLVAHNAGFDVGFIEQNCRYQDIEPHFVSVDTVALARVLLPSLSRFKLDTVAKALNISLENHHRAVDDAGATAEIFVKFVEMLKERDITTLKGVNRFGNLNPDAIRKLPTYHVIILARNDIGRVNLYTLISESHLTYYGRRPRIPKSVLNKYREGLLVGSACEAGELYQALLNGKSAETIARIVDFYDYLEIQPLGNNKFMIESDKVSSIHSMDDIKDINRKIVKLGTQFNKPVVGTCDVHFMDPEDEVYRRIIMAGKGFTDADEQAPLYLRTTEEMLEEFAYLGSEKAYEIVIGNTNKIANMIEKIAPVRPDKCPPVIENSDQLLRDICYDKAHSMYGETLPDIVKERLERELNSIISNGFAVMYIIAQKLVWKSNEDGYLVGSRGSVGSSFVATMAGITEVNPLRPHYYCEHCHYSDFDSEEVRKYAGGCGHDMPDKNCPKCGKKLIKDGFDIPFETFLGFKGNKEPDIDLNFSGDYQSKAHKYTEVIFGKGQTYRAGTIAALADKTAYGYVKNYYEERGDRKRNCEIDRIVQGCTGIRRSTGQHPGGIVVLPHGEDINSFTPIQHPANDMTTDIITTHFDYHSIDHNLLKLDILGHDDPTMIKTLEELINSDAMDNEYDGVNHIFYATDIPLDDPDVMSLFAGTKALGITPEDIGGCPVGCLGIPEFGTDFVIQMVVDTKPKTLSDLIRISGLSHGTDVWLNNAQTLIEEGKATISTAICTRDDIMTYLINKGMESELSFTIMEKVRKGKGLTPEFEAAMKEADVPDWYIWSCKKIKYMFPKAHAAAYVMMAYRIAYCKVNYPLAYYAAYFGIRASAFSYELMCQGKERLEYHLKEYKKRNDANLLSKKEQDTLKDMRNVQEMYARGFEFLPIDIYKAKASKFLIIGDKLMPPLNTIEGMGDKAAEAVEEASKQGKYLSKDDFRQRTKVSKTVIDLMDEMGLFGELPESNQLSLFDFAN